jgi:zinc-ribbon domain
MKLFKCQSCGQLLYFENRTCQNCFHRLGYLAKENVLSALEQTGTDWTALAEPETLYRFCDNSAFDVCNWLVSADSSEKYCSACRHNRMVPDPQQPGNLAAWHKLEVAKHRLEPDHGTGGSLSIHHLTAGDREARSYSRFGAPGGAGPAHVITSALKPLPSAFDRPCFNSARKENSITPSRAGGLNGNRQRAVMKDSGARDWTYGETGSEIRFLRLRLRKVPDFHIANWCFHQLPRVSTLRHSRYD